MNRSVLSSKRMDYGTPDDVFDWLNRQFSFTIDLAAVASNAKYPRFFSPKDNSLAQSWEGETGFLNPEYGRGIGQWLDKTRDEAMLNRALVVLLIPARVDTDWWKTFVMSTDGAAGRLLRSEYRPDNQVLWLRWAGLITGVYFHDQRIPFDGMENGAPFPSAIVIQSHPSRRPPVPKMEPGELCLTSGWPR
jgi:phage N-6-adenine-methyltransferase